MAVVSLLELLLAEHLREVNCPIPEREHKFCAGRRWAFDFAWPEYMIAVEVEGGLHGGRHVRADGFTEDCAKYNEATLAGWRLYRFTAAMVNSGYAKIFILHAMHLGPHPGRWREGWNLLSR